MAEICYNQPDFDYRREAGLNQSSLKKILDSPAHYQVALKHRFLPTPAMEIGTAVHSLVLDGEDAFNASYVKKPDNINLTTKEGKAWKADQGRKKILTTGGKDDAWNAIHGMAKSLQRLDWYRNTGDEYIKRNEVSIYWDWLGQKCKARLDSILVDEGIVLDLKSTDSIDPTLFTKKVVSLGYDFQAGYYTKAAEEAYGKPFRFIFVAVERKPPYDVDLFEVDQEMMEEGLVKCIAALRTYSTCKSLDMWPSKDPTIKMLSYPAWHKKYGTLNTEPEEVCF